MQAAVSLRDAAARSATITPSQLKKRKASDESLVESTKSRKLNPPPVPTPGTPVSEPSPLKMDSDDEVMSDLQSADELDLDEGTQDSDIGGGILNPPTHTIMLIVLQISSRIKMEPLDTIKTT